MIDDRRKTLANVSNEPSDTTRGKNRTVDDPIMQGLIKSNSAMSAAALPLILIASM